MIQERKYALLFTRRKDGSITQGALPRWAQREQGWGYCSVALHLAFICRHSVQERAPRTGRLSAEGVSGVWGTGDICVCFAIAGGSGRDGGAVAVAVGVQWPQLRCQAMQAVQGLQGWESLEADAAVDRSVNCGQTTASL